jgi:hypothetical protein
MAEDRSLRPPRCNRRTFLASAKPDGPIGNLPSSQGYLTTQARRLPINRIFQPPFVLLNQGFTSAVFFDYQVRFQHSLQSIAGEKGDEDSLLWLAVFLRSRMARYFVFHTAANLGTERDKVHMPEFLRLPFFLPDFSHWCSGALAICGRNTTGSARTNSAIGCAASFQLVPSQIAPGLDGISETSHALAQDPFTIFHLFVAV